MEGQRVPPLPIRILGTAISFAVARAPILWPLLRRPTQRFWDRTALGWDERIRPDTPEHLAPLVAASDKLAASPERVLELGTGTGAGAFTLARRFPAAEVHAVDISEAMLRAARAKVPPELAARVHFAVADVAALPFEDQSFDLVAQLNLPAYFDEIARVLRPGGHVIVASSLGPTTPYYTAPRLLRRKFRRRGVAAVANDRAGDGTYWLGRRA